MPEQAADVGVRPMTDADVAVAQEMSYDALRTAGRHYGWEMPELDDDGRARGERRLRHGLRHDPDGAFVADLDGQVVGIALATRREKLWYLSLLAVATDVQARGIGRRLLDAALSTLDDAGALCASDDPKALRRYRAAGFDLLPCYETKGCVDRTRLPAIRGVRPTTLSEAREFVEDVATPLRGAPHGPDLDHLVGAGAQVHVTDSAAGRGYVVFEPDRLHVLGATTTAAAHDLLWTVLAESVGELRVGWLDRDQQWALDVVLAAGLPLGARGSRCVRGSIGPMAPYIPSGAWG